MRRVLLAALLGSGIPAALCAFHGCAFAGSTSIRNGRSLYNDALISTNNEQLLAMIVRMRYYEPAGLLTVASITANMRIQASVGAQFGVGPEANFAGNLVPISAGALVEENPTISYVPVQGQEYMRRMLSPLPLDLVVLLLNALGDDPGTMTLLVSEINGIRNPAVLHEPSIEEVGRFEEIAKILASLHRSGALNWGALSSTANGAATAVPAGASVGAGGPPAGPAPATGAAIPTASGAREPGAASVAPPPTSFALVLRGSGDAYEHDLSRLHALLELPPPKSSKEIVTLRVVLGVGARSANELEVRTRSVFDLLEIAGASIEIPPEHLESGLAKTLPPSGPVGRDMCIHASRERPADVLVAVQQHGWWYSIDARDPRSKQSFRIIDAIFTALLADSSDSRASLPILTVPASR